MREVCFAIGLIVSMVCAVPARGHGPQIQVTNDGNKIVTRQVYLDEPYNVFPNPPSPATSVYIMPLAPVESFGGTAYWVQPSARFPANCPGLAWTYGWTYDTEAHVTFPLGSNFVESLTGDLQKWTGTAFTTSAAAGAQMQIFKSLTNFGVSGSASSSVNLKALAAPTSPADSLLNDHTAVNFQLLGDGIVPSETHIPAAVADGIYLSQLKLHLANPGGGSIQDSDPFYFVLYKGVDVTSALAAAQTAFEGASIQVVPEPGGFVLAGMLVAGSIQRRRSISR